MIVVLLLCLSGAAAFRTVPSGTRRSLSSPLLPRWSSLTSLEDSDENGGIRVTDERTNRRSGRTETYRWVQTSEEIEFFVPVADARARDLVCDVSRDSIRVERRASSSAAAAEAAEASQVLLEGTFSRSVKSGQMTWIIIDEEDNAEAAGLGRALHLVVPKVRSAAAQSEKASGGVEARGRGVRSPRLSDLLRVLCARARDAIEGVPSDARSAFRRKCCSSPISVPRPPPRRACRESTIVVVVRRGS